MTNNDEAPIRTRAALRALINQMLDGLRNASNKNDWSQESRARAEAELAQVMESVRREAVSDYKKDT